MNLSSLLIGIIIGVVGAFGTGFLKKAGEDMYSWIKGKINPNSLAERQSQVVVHLRGAEAEPTDHFDLVSTETLSQISIDDIEKAIESASPLQRENIAENYVGLKIEWNSYLKTATKLPNGNVSLRLAIDTPYRGRAVLCEVPEDEYRELSILPEDTPIRVSGEITEASSFDVKLTNVRLQIVIGSTTA